MCVLMCDFGQFLNFANVSSSSSSSSAGTFGGHCSWSGILAADTFVSVSFYLYLWHVYKGQQQQQSEQQRWRRLHVFCLLMLLYFVYYFMAFLCTRRRRRLLRRHADVVCGFRFKVSLQTVCTSATPYSTCLPASLGAGASTSSSSPNSGQPGIAYRATSPADCPYICLLNLFQIISD